MEPSTNLTECESVIFKLIPLTRGFFAIVDPEDFDELSKYRWQFSSGGYPQRRPSNAEGGPAIILMHRHIMGNDPRAVDHRNLNKLDNRKTNLRWATQGQNVQNRGIQKNNKTGYKGVSFMKSRGKFRASIHPAYKSIHLGLFATAEEAKAVYDAAAEIYFGEFSRSK